METRFPGPPKNRLTKPEGCFLAFIIGMVVILFLLLCAVILTGIHIALENWG